MTIELKNRLPNSFADIDESYKVDVIRRDATLATDPPVRTLALPPYDLVFLSQSSGKHAKEKMRRSHF